MNTSQNTQLTRQFIETVLNTGDMDSADDYLAPEFIEHSPPPGFPGDREGVKQVFRMLHQAFPDFKYVIEESIAEEDLVVHRITAQGTMQGSFFGMPPTGKHAIWPEIHIARVQDGRIVEHWDVIDRLTRLQQILGDKATYARIVTATVSADMVDEAVQLWRDTVLPSVQQQKGFKGVRLLVDRNNGTIISIGLWESETDFLATVTWNEGQIARFADFFDTPPAVAGYEVVVDM